jgi:hypothetical protein
MSLSSSGPETKCKNDRNSHDSRHCRVDVHTLTYPFDDEHEDDEDEEPEDEDDEESAEESESEDEDA